MGADKRKYLRFECLVPVDLVEIRGEAETDSESVLIEDVSREGMRMVLDLGLDLSPGAEIDFKVHNPDELDTCSVTGEIVWSKSKDRKLEVGIKLRKMDDCIKNKLLDIGYARWLELQTAQNKEKTP
jgi:hypothetical protein